MIRSMTGYGRGESVLYDRKFIVEIKSVNHRYNDVSIKLPKMMNAFEDRVKKMLAQSVFRGKTDIYISFQSFSNKDIKIHLNEVLADAYFEKMNALQQRYKLQDTQILQTLLNFPEVLSTDSGALDANGLEELWQGLELAVAQALENFIKMRATEGKALKENLLQKIADIQGMLERIQVRAPLVQAEVFLKLKTRVQEMMEGYTIDDTRMLTEVALLMDRACIDEEITRLCSHIEQLREILAQGGIVGRKLDFLIQEMNREANTMGSKSNDIEMTKIVVDLKSEIEKIREQIQNIE